MKLKTSLLAAIALVATTMTPALASQRNGELCSVQSYDGTIRASALTYGSATASQATRTQIADAGAWCTGMISSNWYGADKAYDDYAGQVNVCFIHNPGSTLDIEVYSDYAREAMAESTCRDLVSGRESNLTWYP